jgi:sugar/nucleoside kinase (ribokinase family)
MGNPRVLSIGNTVLDVIGKTPDALPKFGELAAGRGPADIDIGGNGAIAAAQASVLGAESSLASTVGDDAWGTWLQQNLSALGVDTGQVIVVKDQPTATTLSLVRTDGERALLTHNGASESHELSKVSLDQVGDGDWVLVSSLFLVQAYSGDDLRLIIKEAKKKGARVALDLAWDCTGEWELADLAVDEADIVLGNHQEIRAVTCSADIDRAIERMMEHDIETLVVKLGAEGARVITRSGTDVTVPAFHVEPLNSTGTGDVFNGTMLVALSQGKDLEEAVLFGCAAGALRVSGGCHTFPTMEQVEALVNKGV